MTDAERRLEALLGALDELGYATVETVAGRIVAASPRFCELVGYGVDVLLAWPDVTPLFVPDRRQADRDLIARAERGEPAFPTTMLLLRGDGTPVTVVAGGRPMGGADDTRLVLLVRDASDDTYRREQLAAYSEVLQRMPVGMLLWRIEDPDDPASPRIVAANRAATAGSAVRAGDLLGKTVAEAFPGPAGKSTAELILDAYRTRRVRDLGEEHLPEGEGPYGPGTYRRAIVPLPGDVVVSLIENVSTRRERDRHRQELLRRIVDAGDEERRRVAADLHDDVIQSLAALLLELDASQRGADPAAVEQSRRRVEDSLRSTIGRLRRLVFDLAPPELDEGLAAGVDIAAEKTFAGTATNVVTSIDLADEPDAETRAVIYRMVAEALTNVRRHADADTVWIELRSEDGWLLVSVRDDGRGAEELVTPPGHLGLRTMRERAQLLGGTASVQSTPGQGTVVGFRVPLHPAGGGDERAGSLGQFAPGVATRAPRGRAPAPPPADRR